MTSRKNSKKMLELELAGELASLLNDHELGEITLRRRYGEDDQIELCIKKPSALVPAPAPYATPPGAAPAGPIPASPPAKQADAASSAPSTPSDPSLASAITSPMVGTVYLAPEPGAEPFVKIGDKVEIGQTLIIIEAMKTMNQIPSTRAGKVTRILVEDSTPVEFGDPLVVVE